VAVRANQYRFGFAAVYMTVMVGTRLEWPMNAFRCLLPVAAMVLATGTLSAAPLTFGANPITCTDPVGATVPVPCALTTVPRPDGYALIGYSFNFIIPPPPGGPPFPPPVIVQNDSMRDFFNPVMQDITVNIFGNTKVDVIGAPILFFVNGTLDGVTVTSFSMPVGGMNNNLAWNVLGVAPDVPAGIHTADMHFGIIQIVQGQQSQVNVSSVYEVALTPVPEPSAMAQMFLGLLGIGFATSRRWR
jgi:hypothetical protein